MIKPRKKSPHAAAIEAADRKLRIAQDVWYSFHRQFVNLDRLERESWKRLMEARTGYAKADKDFPKEKR